MNKQKMIESESQLKRMTKSELKQWLTKHDQRLPPIDKKKPYYFDRAVSYFKLLQKEQAQFSSQPNRSKVANKSKTKVINHSRTKKKTNSSQSSSQSKTPTKPTSIRKKIGRTQRRHSSIGNGSPSPSLTRSKRKIIKVKRKTPTKQSPSLTKSLKKKRDRVRRATADPASLLEIEKDAAREREERDLNQSSDDNDSDDVDISDITQKTEAESENGGDFNNYQQFQRSDNLKKRQFVCSRDPEKMTIHDLQQWLDRNNIDFQQRQKKATYVKLVRKHSLPTSFNSNANSSFDANPNLAAKQKKYVSPVRKSMNDAPLPRNLRQSPLTPPRDDEKMQSRSRIPQRRQIENQQKEGRKSGVLLTPALNKTGIRPIETPEKAAMRDEIRCLLNLDDEENDLNPVFAIKGDGDIDNDKNDTNGITPGGPSSYDPEVLNNVLSDVRKAQEQQKYAYDQPQRSPLKSAANDMPNIDIERELNEVAYNNESDMDSKENDCINVGNVASNSFFDNLMNRFSPYKQVTQSAMKDAANSVFKVHDTSILRKGKRTIPSPIDDGSPEQHYHGNNNHSGSVSMSPPIQQQEASPKLINNGNFRNDVLIPPSPIETYKQKMTDYNDDEDDIPQTPAVPHSHYNQYQQQQQQQQFNIINPRRTPAQKKQKSPPKQHKPSQEQQVNIRRRHQGIGRNHGKINNMYINNNNHNKNHHHQIQDSPAISPSTNIDSSFKLNNNNHNSKPSSFDSSGAIKNQQPKSNGMGKIFAKFTFFALIIAAVSCFFILFDGMTQINQIMDEITEFINNFNAEQETLFCDSNKDTIAKLPLPDDFICHPCPKHAAVCLNGRVQCKTNYILQDDKCILDGITVKFAFEIKNQVVKILSQRRGQSECGEIMDSDFSMTQDELMSNTEIIDERKKTEAFEYFKKNILPESPIVSRNKYGRYYSHIAIKSPKCRIKEWAMENILGLIATSIIIMVVFAIWRKQKAKQRERTEIQNMTDEIYKILDELDQFENGQHIPVDRIRQRIKPQSNKIWDEAEKNIQTDMQIQKSMRMIDGLQRKCWRVSISKLSSQSQGNNNKYQKWSPAEQNQRQQQQQWNFNNNNNNNHNNNGGFNFVRNNEQTRFPPHSKRSMW